MEDTSQQSAPTASDSSSSFQLKKMANFGTGEPWVARIQMGIPELTPFIFDSDEARKAFSDAWMTAGFKLGEAFGTIVDLRRLAADPETPTLDLSRTYNSFYSLLWAAYKDRWQAAMKLLGYDVSFLFVADRNFDAKFEEFATAHPELDRDEIYRLSTSDRGSWQNKLGEYRNQEIEHRTGTQRVEDFEDPRAAEAAFYNVWRTMEDWAIMVINALVKPPMQIEAIPKNLRNPSAPKKYRVAIDPSALPQQEASAR